jgi:hypothetical protein
LLLLSPHSWERQILAESIFSAIGVRVVDLMHASKHEVEEDEDNASQI